MTAAARPRPAAQDAWSARLGRWDIYFAIIFAAVLPVVWLTSTWPQRAIAGAAMLALVPWYLLGGRPASTSTPVPRWRAAGYIAGVFVLFGIAQSQDVNAWFLVFALCPQFFWLTSPRLAMWAASGLNILAWLLLVEQVRSLAAAAVSLAITAAGVGFSVIYGGWVTRIIGQSRERAQIIEQLEATQGELAAVSHQAGMLAERQRLAGDIHDTIAQGFSSVIMLIQAAEAEVSSDPAQARRHLQLAGQTARENLADARSLVAALAPAQLDGSRLEDALRRLAGQAAGLGTATGVTVSGAPRRLDIAAEVMLLRVSQEALANVRKHAAARRAQICLSYDPAAVRLQISDDGNGFDTSAASSGYGLRGMQARVSEAGGQLAVRSTPGEGTCVSVEVPG